MAAERRAAKEAYLKSIKEQKQQGGLAQKVPEKPQAAGGLGLDFDGGKKDKQKSKPVGGTAINSSSARDKKWEEQRQKFLSKQGVNGNAAAAVGGDERPLERAAPSWVDTHADIMSKQKQIPLDVESMAPVAVAAQPP